MNKFTDVEIPRTVWEAWKPAGGKRKIRRALSDEERTALEARRAELAPFVAGFEGREEENRVVLALADMFASYRSMRVQDENVVAQVDALKRALLEFPMWAIEKACLSIRTNGIWRDGRFWREWPPNDSEIIHEVRSQLRLYGDQHQSAVALLTAEVEK